MSQTQPIVPEAVSAVYVDEIPVPDISHLVMEDDAPVDNIISEKQMRLLVEPLYSSWPGPLNESGEPRPFAAFANVGLFFSLHEPPLVPDVMLSLDVSVPADFHEKQCRSYLFWEYGKAPDVAIEIVSDREGGEDDKKLRGYARVGVRYYVIYDPDEFLSHERLRIYELRGRSYEQITAQPLPEVGLSLALWQGEFEGSFDTWLRWCDLQGNLLPTGVEARQYEAARADRAEAELNKVRAEKERMAARLRELGIDPDQL
ncbi:MAG: Uma2 family endonuclease [Blastocatellia bacterium]